MKKTIPFYLLQSLTLASIFALSACTNQAVKPLVKKQDGVSVIEAESKEALTAEEITALRPFEIKAKIEQAQAEKNWMQFIQLNHLLWQQSNDVQQAMIEQTIWYTLTNFPYADTQAILKTLNESDSPVINAWGQLIAVIKGSAQTLETRLAILREQQADAIYSKHLLPELTAKIQAFRTPKQIAVMLPFQGKYKPLSQKIVAGLLKAFYASDQSTRLKFYDSSQLTTIEATYQQAKQDGAEFIIGPLRREAVEQLVALNDPEILALNKVGGAPFPQFSFKSADEVTQMVALFKQQNYKHIGILSNDGRVDLKTASELQHAWQSEPGHTTVLSIYPDNNPKLRDALGALINENFSNERHQNLRFTTKQKFTFFPRTRQDFDAIVIMDNRRRTAVFKPQFAFFELKVPVYGTPQLSPKNLQDNNPIRDLKGIQFLSPPVTLHPENLNSHFEAFGWDSFQVATFLNPMRLGSYLTTAKTGILSLESNQILQQLIWARYTHSGQIEPFEPVAPPPPEIEHPMATPTP